MHSTHQEAEMSLTYRIANSPVNIFPFPHFYIENVFPEDFYQIFQESLPVPEQLYPIKEVRGVKGYDERFVMPMEEKYFNMLPEKSNEFWQQTKNWMLSGRFANLLISKFGNTLNERLKNYEPIKIYNELLLVQDTTHYALGPHTDAPRKVITVLFYLPKDLSQSHLGTSIYVPKQAGFVCAGGPHHNRADFHRMATMPFKPNSMFVFMKTNNSFHGVEKVQDDNCRRWLLLFDVFMKKADGTPL